MFAPEVQRRNPEIEAAINLALVAAREREPSRNYLGASRWGHHCERALGYEYFKTPRDNPSQPKFPADLYSVFDMGHDAEARLADYLRLAGFDLQTHGPDGKQIGFTALDGRLGGHCDGIIHAGPGITKAPLVWECKALNDKSWNDTASKGVKVSKPVYYAQMQTYIAYLDLKGFLFTARNRDTGELYVELGEPDYRCAQEVSDRAMRVVEASGPESLPRCSSVETDHRCRFCDYAKRCWAKAEPKPERAKTFSGIKFVLGDNNRKQ